MNRGTAAVVQLGKNVTAGSFSGLNVLTNVILGKKEALQKDFNGLVLTDLVMLGKKISHITIITVTVGPAVSPLLLPDAIANSLKYVKAYGGTEQRNLPDDYVELKSLTSSAGTGAHVNTGVKAASTVKAEFVCDRPIPPASGTVWQVCSALLDNNGQFAIFESTNAQGGKYIALTYGASSGSLVYVETSSMTKSTFVIDGGVLTYDNGAKTVTSPQAGTTFTTNNDIWLFSRENASVESLSSVTIYSAKFWDNGVLVRNLVCAKRKSDNKLGMYDLVNDNFIECQGTFTAGANVVLPTPETPMNIVSNNGVLKARHQSGLPLGYTQLTYIQSDGRQMINTGYVLQETDSVEVDYELTDLTRTGDKFILGAQPVSGAPGGFWVETYDSSNVWYIRYGSTVSANTYGSVTPTSQLSGTLAISKNSFVVNGVKILTPNFVSMPATPMTIFNRISLDGSIANFGAFAQISEVRVKNGNNIVHKYIPVRNSNNELGMYDLADSNPATAFYTNAGTGDFTAGNPVSDPVEIYTDGTVETIKDTLNNTATAEMLLKVGDYQDVQEILSGAVTRKVGVKVLDGTEKWMKNVSLADTRNAFSSNSLDFVPQSKVSYCTHLPNVTSTSLNGVYLGAGMNFILGASSSITTAEQFKAWLADQLAAGTPVIVVYPLATPTTESVTGQTLQVTQGDNVLEITQASIDGLELEAEYEQGVQASVQEIEP